LHELIVFLVNGSVLLTQQHDLESNFMSFWTTVEVALTLAEHLQFWRLFPLRSVSHSHPRMVLLGVERISQSVGGGF